MAYGEEPAEIAAPASLDARTQAKAMLNEVVKSLKFWQAEADGLGLKFSKAKQQLEHTIDLYESLRGALNRMNTAVEDTEASPNVEVR